VESVGGCELASVLNFLHVSALHPIHLLLLACWKTLHIPLLRVNFLLFP
jgi:hypothetical protein